ncbi:MAG: PQQ-binding-like beta-propeller repeat protein, partial [Clostridia bacterium]|nr:PQQ-binding-like beta-propeller repeat protein [Clostridia bacterium]
RRINAMTGEEDWAFEIKCKPDTKTELSGCKASPVIGQHSIDQLVIFTVNKVNEGGSRIVALNKATGEAAWSYDLKNEAISSPVAVYNEAGDAWLIQADLAGTLHLLDARSGAHLSELDLGGSIEGSPAVYKDTLVIGTCSKSNHKLYGIKIE